MTHTIKLTILSLMLAAITTTSIQSKVFVTHCTVTTYNAVVSQCDADPLITADGTRINHKDVKSGKQRIAAISRDLLWCLPFGSVIHVEGYGQYVVADLMNKRYNHCIDLLIPGDKHFKKHKVKVTLVR